MARKKSENFYLDSLFTFESSSCDMVSIENPEIPGERPSLITKVGAIESSRIRFAFGPKSGLVRLNPNGTIAEKNVLGSFLSKSTDEGFRAFFNDNGFLFDIPKGRYLTLSSVDFAGVTKRIKKTLEILDIAGKSNSDRPISDSDFHKFADAVFYLLFSPSIRITCPETGLDYTSAQSSLGKLLESSTDLPDAFTSQQIHDGTIDVVESDGTVTHVDSRFWQNVNSNYDERDDCFGFRDTVRYFVNGTRLETALKSEIEGLYHFFLDVAPISGFDPLELWKNPGFDICGLSAPSKSKFIRLGLDIAKSEIDQNIKNVRPSYDAERMEPRWQVDSLLSAMYFSIFYLRPGVELMRPCANPNCGKYFKVGRTDSKKLYCSPECRNRASQARHRGQSTNKLVTGVSSHH